MENSSNGFRAQFDGDDLAFEENQKKIQNKSRKGYSSKYEVIQEILLHVLHEESTLSSKHLFCVDLQSKGGVAGLQWKRHYQSKLNVLVAQNKAISDIEKNCEESNFLCSKFNLSYERQPGDVQLEQKDGEIHACQCPTNVLLHLEAFDFVFLQPEGLLANHFDPVFSNLRNNGLLCLTSSDISVQFTRTANVIRRYCHAQVTKTEYMREMAVRVIIGCAVRSASRCNKGLEILMTTCVEDNFLIVLRVHRGPQHADHCLDQVKPQLYCQICEEHCFLPGGLTPIENPYALLACTCHEKTPGRTAILLGPMWSGSIFNTTFISKLLQPHEDLPEQSSQFKKVLQSILEEAICSDLDVPETNGRDHQRDPEEPEAKRPKIDHSQNPTTIHPPFYINIHKMKFKDVIIPKMRKVLSFLRSEGYRASRTHFDSNSVRTNANRTQFHHVLLKFCKKSRNK